MPATFASARHAVDLLLRLAEARPMPVSLWPLAEEWGVHWRSVRRIARVLVEEFAQHPGAGRLEPIGAGQRAALLWRAPARSQGSRVDAAALLAALGPWHAIGAADVGRVLERHLEGVARDIEGERYHDLTRRAFYYQPYLPREHRDPDALNEVLTALFYRRRLAVERYHGPRRKHEAIELEPWTLVHALDGLYVLGPLAGRPEPRMWALHRMEGVTAIRHSRVEVPDDYDPKDLLGHGYGPFVGRPGRVRLRVPAEEAPYVLESPLPHQVGEPVELPDGSFEVVLNVGLHRGLELWARGMGVEVEALPDAPEAVEEAVAGEEPAVPTPPPAREVRVEPHPLLDPVCLLATFHRPLGETPAPPAIRELLRLDASSPFAPRGGEEADAWRDSVRRPVRDLLRHGGFKPNGRGRPASEHLALAIRQGRLGPDVSINAVVDAINAVSLHSGVPISAVDADLARPPWRIAVAGPGDRYAFNPSGQVIDLAGLLALHDAEGPCGAPVKDSQRTKTHAGTTRVLIVLWGTRALPGLASRAADWLVELLDDLAEVDPVPTRGADG